MSDLSARIDALISQLGDNSGLVRELIDLSVKQAISNLPPPGATVHPDATGIAQAVAQAIAATLPAPTPPPPRDIDLALPEKFEGKPEDVESFLSRVKDYLALKEDSYPTAKRKIQWALLLFKGPRAEPWASAKRAAFTSETDPDPYTTFADYEKNVRTTFSTQSRAAKADLQLTAPHRLRLRERAALWYRKVLPSLYGDERERVQQRLYKVGV